MSEPVMPTRSGEFASQSDAYVSEPPAAIQQKGFIPARLANEVTVSTVANNTTYTVTIDTVPYAFTSDSSATDAEIVAGLMALLNATALYVATVTKDTTNKFQVVSAVVGTSFVLTVGANLSSATITVKGSRVPAEWLNWPFRALYDLKNWIIAKINRIPGNVIPTELTVASGSVTATLGMHVLDTESNAATDDLTTIVPANLDEGRLLYLTCADASRVVTVKHSQGSTNRILISDGSDIILDDPKKVLVLRRSGNDWYEVSYSAVREQLQPTGAVQFFYRTDEPNGWKWFNGQTLLKSIEPNLWAVLNGMEGIVSTSTTFTLPNLPAATLVNYIDGDANFGTVGKTGGAQNVTLTTAMIPSHTHTEWTLDGHYAQGAGGSDQVRPIQPTNGGTTGSTGGGGSHPNMPPYLVGRLAIKT